MNYQTKVEVAFLREFFRPFVDEKIEEELQIQDAKQRMI